MSYDLAHWLTFFAAAVVLNLSPGPDILFILGSTMRGGRRAGLAAMFGIWTGALGHVAMAALGLSALLVKSAVLFTIVKWLGALYLIWLGVKALAASDAPLALPSAAPASAWAIFRQGMLVNLLNPKVALFFLAFLPQFVEAGAGPVPLQLALHGVGIILVAMLIEPWLVIGGDRLLKTLRRRPQLGRWLERTVGGLLVFLGLRLAAERG